jgi:hypothetical protein
MTSTAVPDSLDEKLLTIARAERLVRAEVLVKNYTIGHKHIRTCFYYEETNIVVALSEFSSAVILINWYDFSVT